MSPDVRARRYPARSRQPLKAQLKPADKLALPFLLGTRNPPIASLCLAASPAGSSARPVGRQVRKPRQVLRALGPHPQVAQTQPPSPGPLHTPHPPVLGFSQPRTRARRPYFAEIRWVPYILLHNAIGSNFAGEVLGETAPRHKPAPAKKGSSGAILNVNCPGIAKKGMLNSNR